jgi:hypothetical protein
MRRLGLGPSRRVRSSAKRTRLLFVTDLHGSEVTFRKALNGVGVYGADTLIVGGDLTGKQIVPVVGDGDRWSCTLMGTDLAVTAGELDNLIRTVSNLGQYPVLMSPDEYAELEQSEKLREHAFREACHTQVVDWMDRLASRLGDSATVYVTGGNDDYLSIEPLIDSAEWVVNAEGRVVELLPGVPMISTGYGNETPWRCPRDEPESSLAARIEAMTSRLDDARSAVFNFHVPPYASGLDRCMALDISVSPPQPLPGEQTDAGSTAVRQALERHQPVLSLHGHIHESRGIRRIGITQCVNPGSEYSEGVLNAAIIDFRDGDLANIQLVAA